MYSCKGSCHPVQMGHTSAAELCHQFSKWEGLLHSGNLSSRQQTHQTENNRNNIFSYIPKHYRCLILITLVMSTDQPSLRSGVLLEKLIVTQLVTEFLTFHGTQRFIIIFTRPHHWSLSWARCCLHHSKQSIQFQGPMQHFITRWSSTVWSCWPFTQPITWRTSPPRVSETAYSLNWIPHSRMSTAFGLNLS
jgi:hypothetical protein